MNCREFQESLEQDVLTDSAAAHVTTCANCRDLQADFNAIQALAVELGAEDIAPPDRIWVSLRSQLESEGLIRSKVPASPRATAAWWSVFQKPAFAGGFLAVILSAGILTGINGNLSPAPQDADLQAPRQIVAVAPGSRTVKDELLTAVNETVSGIAEEDPALTETLRRNLSIVDNLIAVCEKSVREEPENEMARDYLNGAYEQKAELLATAMNHGSMGGLR